MKTDQITGHVLKLSDDRSISWIGKCPWTQGVCIGTDTGEVLFPDPISAAETQGNMAGVFAAIEAVNGVAFSGDFIGVSTIGEIAIGERSEFGHKTRHTFDRGAHGIIAAAHGGFFACLGDDGVLFIDPNKNQTTPLQISSFPTYFYKIASIHVNDRYETFIAAMGDHGLLNFSHGPAGFDNKCRIFQGNKIDFIDVCSIANSNYPFAFAALGNAGKLILCKDIKTQNASHFDFGFTHHTAYEMRYAQGALFLLFDDRMVIIRDLVQRFLNDVDLDKPHDIIEIPVDASDIFVVDDSLWLLVGDDACELSVASIIQDEFSADAIGNATSHDDTRVRWFLRKHIQPIAFVTAFPKAKEASFLQVVGHETVLETT